MTGAQFPAISCSTAVRVPDAVLAPGTALRLQRGYPIARAPEERADPYRGRRALPAGLLVDVYG